MPNEDLHLQVLRALERDPSLSQRQLAAELGISVGGTNYALKAVVERGWVKVQNFRHSENKRGYLYKLTPAGLTEKARLAYRLLQRKRQEHQRLLEEIETLRGEVEGAGPSRPSR